MRREAIMKVLFLGWEFPPHSVGGLGRHTYEVVKELSKIMDVSLILPFSDYQNIQKVKFKIAPLNEIISVYKNFKASGFSELYEDIQHEIESYTKNVLRIAKTEKFDIIQANDWITARAGIEVKKMTGKPLVITMHSTESDRTIGHPWPAIERQEKGAVQSADAIVAVSERLKRELIKNYGVKPEKISVIYNAIDRTEFNLPRTNERSKIVLYTGRLSPQKGIDHLIRAFKTVTKNDKDALLYIVGEGPELKNLIELSIDLGLSDKVIFLGRVSDEDIDYFYSIARVFVMPSVSEPFGITALEAIASGTPAIVSVQSGVAEVLKNVFKVDFWDSDQMADMILGLLTCKGINETMSAEAYKELTNLTWKDTANKFFNLYKKLTKS